MSLQNQMILFHMPERTLFETGGISCDSWNQLIEELSVAKMDRAGREKLAVVLTEEGGHICHLQLNSGCGACSNEALSDMYDCMEPDSSDYVHSVRETSQAEEDKIVKERIENLVAHSEKIIAAFKEKVDHGYTLLYETQAGICRRDGCAGCALKIKRVRDDIEAAQAQQELILAELAKSMGYTLSTPF